MEDEEVESYTRRMLGCPLIQIRGQRPLAGDFHTVYFSHERTYER